MAGRGPMDNVFIERLGQSEFNKRNLIFSNGSFIGDVEETPTSFAMYRVRLVSP